MNDLPHNPVNLPRRPLFVRLLQWKVVIPLIVVCAIFAAPLIYRQWLLSQIPDIGDPFDVEAFGTVELADEDNAKFDYEAAVAMLIPLPEIVDENSPYGENIAGDAQQYALDNGWEAAAPEIRKWVEDNRPAMERWKAGTEKPDFLYYQPRDVHLETPLTSLQEFREFHRLATMEASHLLAKEKPEESWIWARAILRCSRHFGRHGGAIERVFGMSFHAISINVVMEITQDDATTEQLLAEMFDGIRKEFDQTAKNSTMLKCEYLAIKNSMQNERVLNDWVAVELNDIEKNQFSSHRLLKIEPLISQLIWQQYIANLLEQIDLPPRKRQPRTNYFEAFSRIPGKIYGTEFLPPSEIERLFMETIILRKLNPNYSFLDQNCTREQVRQHALELCIALQIYHRRHDHYPATLDELVHEKIIDEIPIDPFSPTGDRMRYRLYNGEAYVWSIDENGVDDGGLFVDSDDIAKKLLDTGLRLGDSVAAKKP